MATLAIEWFGTAAFRLSHGGTRILLDPYFSRNPYAKPATVARVGGIARADHVFLSHGHFDHVMDVPELLSLNPALTVYGPARAIETVARETAEISGTHRRLHALSTEALELGSGDGRFRVTALPSKHVHFDRKLVASTLARAFSHRASFRHLRPSLLTQYPCGETLAYAFELGGRTVLFLGSAGPETEQLLQWKKTFGRVDCLLVPLQGNTDICSIGAKIVETLRPHVVIPHHHDDFYPPISREIDITRFKDEVARRAPECRIEELTPGGGPLVFQELLDLSDSYLSDLPASI